MDRGQDITLHLPAEHLPALSEVIQNGLQRTKMDAQTRTELSAWWEAEKEFLDEEADMRKSRQ